MKIKKEIGKLAGTDEARERFRILSRIIVWALLDQGPGKRRRKGNRTRNARQIGRIIHLRRMRSLIKRIARSGYRITSQDRAQCKSLTNVGGIDSLLKDDSLKTMVRKVRKRQTDYESVYGMVTYLIRVDSMGTDFRKAATISLAKASLIYLKPKGPNAVGFKTAENTWGQYAPGSAIIFAIFEFFPKISLSTLDPKTAAISVAEIASTKENTEKFLGYAAFAASSLRKLSKTKAFKNSFKNVVPLAPRSFAPIDRKIIESIRDTAKARG